MRHIPLFACVGERARFVGGWVDGRVGACGHELARMGACVRARAGVHVGRFTVVSLFRKKSIIWKQMLRECTGPHLQESAALLRLQR